MCKYCEKGKYIEERAGDNIFLEIYGKHLRVIGRVLGIPLGRDIIIEYCPMCRKEAGRVKQLLGKYVETLDNHKGIVVKQYKPTGRNTDSIHIQQEDGRTWYCPISDLIYVEEESYDK